MHQSNRPLHVKDLVWSQSVTDWNKYLWGLLQLDSAALAAVPYQSLQFRTNPSGFVQFSDFNRRQYTFSHRAPAGVDHVTYALLPSANCKICSFCHTRFTDPWVIRGGKNLHGASCGPSTYHHSSSGGQCELQVHWQQRLWLWMRVFNIAEKGSTKLLATMESETESLAFRTRWRHVESMWDQTQSCRTSSWSTPPSGSILLAMLVTYRLHACHHCKSVNWEKGATHQLLWPEVRWVFWCARLMQPTSSVASLGFGWRICTTSTVSLLITSNAGYRFIQRI